MARPTTKDDLIKAASGGFEKLIKLVKSMSKKELNTPFCFDKAKKEVHWQRDKNVRDIFIHLHEWHKLLLTWVEANKKGENVVHFLPQPYTWKTYGDMNIEFWKKHQNTPFEKSEALLLKSHEEVMEVINAYSNEALFTNKYFSWTGTTSLGSYCVSATSSHYEWAMKKLRAHKKNCKNL